VRRAIWCPTWLYPDFGTTMCLDDSFASKMAGTGRALDCQAGQNLPATGPDETGSTDCLLLEDHANLARERAERVVIELHGHTLHPEEGAAGSVFETGVAGNTAGLAKVCSATVLMSSASSAKLRRESGAGTAPRRLGFKTT
jgi:hypothetical protein